MRPFIIRLVYNAPLHYTFSVQCAFHYTFIYNAPFITRLVYNAPFITRLCIMRLSLHV
jgi:hypothetical protein